MAADVSLAHSTTAIHGAESDVQCESMDYNQLEYKEDVEMLKTFCEKNRAISGSVYAAVMDTTAVYICAGEDSNDVCELTEWNTGEQLVDQRCGTGRMGAARVNNKIYGRGSPGNYKC
ncbi:hypothetical protein H634G_03671 [Metarhizium anisopliae BRIP 53293]|uniref:Uncharacterized protein n=1 Tax=Metarhizium anisopliae BRIP 53293 TaxID=1291518 RepID=A0A0D9P4E6_METAN|nr:hypothetical protein H634G_03671 [Metarhizium anisopliae BRIP 53293]KJK92097.1 hypothetical protein H633G_04042 [Metarhizium anisopliae BRIP 53284]